MTFCQQVGWAAMSWGLGLLKDASGASAAHPAGWTPVLVALGTLASVGFVFSFLLWKSERSPSGHGLDAVTPTAATETKPVSPA